MRIDLFNESREEIKISVTAQIDDNGDFSISGYDSGKLVTELKGDSSYEYNVSIKKTDKDVLIQKLGAEFPFIKNDEDFMNWLKTNYSHNQGFSEFLNLVDRLEIKRDLFFWP